MKKEEPYDLEERTVKFGEDIITFTKSFKYKTITKFLVFQLVKSATIIGTNYIKADDAVSRRDYVYKIGICLKGAKDSKHWLRMIAKAEPIQSSKCKILWKEAHELVLIFSKILQK